jgi:hypothetical protein
MVFSRGKLPRNLNFSLNGEKLEIVNCFNYLGIELSRTGNFKRAKQSIAGKATVAFYEVLKMGRKHGLSVKIQLDLFDKMVKPILLYGCEVWGFSNNDIIKKVHLKFCKLLLHLKLGNLKYSEIHHRVHFYYSAYKFCYFYLVLFHLPISIGNL